MVVSIQTESPVPNPIPGNYVPGINMRKAVPFTLADTTPPAEFIPHLINLIDLPDSL